MGQTASTNSYHDELSPVLASSSAPPPSAESFNINSYLQQYKSQKMYINPYSRETTSRFSRSVEVIDIYGDELSASHSLESENICTLRVMTYKLYNQADYFPKQRLQSLLKIIHDANPHIVALLEVTPAIFTSLSHDDFLLNTYYLSWNPANMIGIKPASGTLLLVAKTLRIESLVHATLPSRLGKYVIGAEILIPTNSVSRTLPAAFAAQSVPSHQTTGIQHSNTVTKNGKIYEKVAVVVVDLEKLPEAKIFRERQLECIAPLVSSLSNVIVVGDFNIDANDAENEENKTISKLLPHFDDVWKKLRPQDAGLTYDKETNLMINRAATSTRQDLMLAKSSSKFMEPCFVALVGTRAIPNPTEVESSVFTSNHFGIVADFEFANFEKQKSEEDQ